MTERIVTVIPGHIDDRQAARIVRDHAGSAEVIVDRQVWYPYYRYDMNCTLPSLTGRRQIVLPCLVDAVNGIAATCDPFAPADRRVDEEALLDAETDTRSADRAVRGVAAHQLGKRARTIADFDIRHEPAYLLYRGFWIARAGDSVFMVDSVSGALQRLQSLAA